MSYVRVNRQLFCSECNTSHWEENVAFCTSLADVTEAVQAYHQNDRHRMLLMSPSVADDFLVTAHKLDNNSDSAVKGILLGALIAAGGCITLNPAIFFAGAAKTYGAGISHTVRQVIMNHGEKWPYVYCARGVRSRQSDGQMSVMLPSA